MSDWFAASPFKEVRAAIAYQIDLGKMLQPAAIGDLDVEAPYLNAASIQPTGLAVDAGRRMWVAPLDLVKYALKDGDLLVTEGGDIGRSVFFTGEDPYIFQNSLHRVRSKGGNDLRFFRYVLEAVRFSGYLDELTNKATIRHLTAEKLGALRIPLPATEKQRAIADYLDEQSVAMDQISGAVARALTLVEQREAGMLDAILQQVEVPRIRLARVATIQSGVTVNAGRAPGARVYPYLRVANVQANGLDLREVKTIELEPEVAARHMLRTGDVVMTEGGDLDKLGRGSVWSGEIPHCVHQNHVFAVRCGDELLGEYLSFLTRASDARAYFESTGVKTTNLASTNSTKILDWKIPVPPLEAQHTLAKEIEEVLDAHGQIRSRLQRQQTLLTERRQALITAVVTGQIDVTTASRKVA